MEKDIPCKQKPKERRGYIKVRPVDIMIKIITGGKLWYFIMIKLTVLQECIAIIDIHILKNRATKYKKKKVTELKGIMIKK